MAPRRRRAAAQAAAERARTVQLMVASAVQTFGLPVLESAAIRPNMQGQYLDRLATLVLFCRTYRLDWKRRESPDGVLTALRNHQFLDSKWPDLGLQPSAALSHVYPGPARRSSLCRPRLGRAARFGRRLKDARDLRKPA